MTNLPKKYEDLKEWAIAHFRIQAGYIPSTLPPDADFCDGLSFEIYNVQKDRFKGTGGYRVHHANILCQLCFDCARGVMKLYPTLYLICRHNQPCELCGREEDGIPF